MPRRSRVCVRASARTRARRTSHRGTTTTAAASTRVLGPLRRVGAVVLALLPLALGPLGSSRLLQESCLTISVADGALAIRVAGGRAHAAQPARTVLQAVRGAERIAGDRTAIRKMMENKSTDPRKKSASRAEPWCSSCCCASTGARCSCWWRLGAMGRHL